MQTPAQTVLTSLLAMLMVMGNAWGEREFTRDDSSDTSPQLANIEGWGVEEESDDPWTWFGMGYESRKPGSGIATATGAQKSDKK
jgi:hypothetical protein